MSVIYALVNSCGGKIKVLLVHWCNGLKELKSDQTSVLDNKND